MNKDNIIWVEEDSLYLLYRRGKPEHIKALYEEGEIYLNTIDFIRKCDQNIERTDPNDGISKRLFLGNIKVKMSDVGKDISKEGIDIDAHNCFMAEDSKKKGNIYCLSGIYSEHLMGERDNIQFDTKAFGESIIVIYKPKIFIDRVIFGLNKIGYENVIFRRVSYYPNEYSGYVGLFKKHEKFGAQNEARLFVPNEVRKPIKINIGSLSDIAYIENNTLFKLTYTDGHEQLIKLE